MSITEPMTLATDYLIVAVALTLSWKLFISWKEDKLEAKRLWSLSLLFTGFGAFFGGSWHGFSNLLEQSTLDFLWRMTLLSMGMVSLYMALAILSALTDGRHMRIARIVTGIKLITYIATTFFYTKFLLVIIDYGSVLVFILLLSVFMLIKNKSKSASWAITAVLTSFIAAGIQQTGPDLHKHFNHNDLYHIIQVVGVYFFYLSAKHAQVN